MGRVASRHGPQGRDALDDLTAEEELDARLADDQRVAEVDAAVAAQGRKLHGFFVRRALDRARSAEDPFFTPEGAARRRTDAIDDIEMARKVRHGEHVGVVTN
jgi:hypothetical protein